jgi:hypothetical protein
MSECVCGAGDQNPSPCTHYAMSLALGFVLLCFVLFWDKVSLCSPGCLQTQNPPASTSWVLGSQACRHAPPCLAKSFYICLLIPILLKPKTQTFNEHLINHFLNICGMQSQRGKRVHVFLHEINVYTNTYRILCTLKREREREHDCTSGSV